MADKPSKAPAKPESSRSLGEWHPLSNLRREIERLFDDLSLGSWQKPSGSTFDVEPFWRGAFTFGNAPVVDITEHDKKYEITAEMPGMEEEDIDVKYADGVLTIKGEKKEKRKDYYSSERRFGSFQRSFQVPNSIEANKIDASFTNGVLTVTLPKSAEAQKREKKIPIKKG